MTELRYAADGRLQYRSLRPTWQASGAWGEPSQWSDWQNVPTVDPASAGQAEAHPAAAPAAERPSSPSRDSVLEEAAKIVSGTVYKEHYRKWSFWTGDRSSDSEIVSFADDAAAALRALKDVRPDTPPT